MDLFFDLFFTGPRGWTDSVWKRFLFKDLFFLIRLKPLDLIGPTPLDLLGPLGTF